MCLLIPLTARVAAFGVISTTGRLTESRQTDTGLLKLPTGPFFKLPWIYLVVFINSFLYLSVTVQLFTVFVSYRSDGVRGRSKDWGRSDEWYVWPKSRVMTLNQSVVTSWANILLIDCVEYRM